MLKSIHNFEKLDGFLFFFFVKEKYFITFRTTNQALEVSAQMKYTDQNIVKHYRTKLTPKYNLKVGTITLIICFMYGLSEKIAHSLVYNIIIFSFIMG